MGAYRPNRWHGLDRLARKACRLRIAMGGSFCYERCGVGPMGTALSVGHLATDGCEPRQVRKEAAVSIAVCVEVHSDWMMQGSRAGPHRGDKGRTSTGFFIPRAALSPFPPGSNIQSVAHNVVMFGKHGASPLEHAHVGEHPFGHFQALGFRKGVETGEHGLFRRSLFHLPPNI